MATQLTKHPRDLKEKKIWYLINSLPFEWRISGYFIDYIREVTVICWKKYTHKKILFLKPKFSGRMELQHSMLCDQIKTESRELTI